MAARAGADTVKRAVHAARARPRTGRRPRPPPGRVGITAPPAQAMMEDTAVDAPQMEAEGRGDEAKPRLPEFGM